MTSAVSLGELTEPKTRRARNVGLLAPLADDLAEWHAITPHDAPIDLVFPKAGGTPWSDYDWRNWRRRVFRPAAEIAGVGGIRPYDLRHLFVSLLISEGRSIVDVAAQAGHAPSLSYDTYGHVLYDLEQTENRPAEDVISAARAVGVPTVFPSGERPTTEEAPESARYQAKHSSPLRDSNPGPPPYHPGLTRNQSPPQAAPVRS